MISIIDVLHSIQSTEYLILTFFQTPYKVYNLTKLCNTVIPVYNDKIKINWIFSYLVQKLYQSVGLQLPQGNLNVIPQCSYFDNDGKMKR